MTTTNIDIGYNCRSQFVDFHKRKQRWSCIVAHRRAGKTVACVADLVDAALRCDKEDPRFAYIAPTYGQAKDVAWNYLKKFAQTIPGVIIKETELSVTFPNNNARIRLYGSDHYDAMRGIYLDGCVIDEAGDHDPRAYPEVIRPALSDRKGWAVFIGTPKGQNAFFDIFEKAKLETDRWFSLTLRASETGLVDAAELHDARMDMSKEQYAQEYECSFSAGIRGAYYGSLIEEAEQEGRLRSVPLDKAADVFASLDLGYNDSTAIWVGQLIGSEYHFIDYYEDFGQELSVYADWLKSRPYPIHKLILPHDAGSHELQTGKSRETFFKERDFKTFVLDRTKSVITDIDYTRTRFNRFYFDNEKCARGIKCLRNYQASYSEKNQVLSENPLHNWASNGADSFRYFVLGAHPPKHKQDVPKERKLVKGLA